VSLTRSPFILFVFAILPLLLLLAVGGGKSLTARLAGQRAGAVAAPPPPLALAQQQQQQAQQQPGAPPSNQNIVAGYNVEALVDAALGKAPMPTAPTFLDAYGQPLTQIVPILPVPAAAPALTNQGLLATLQQVNSQPPLPPPPLAAAATQKTRVLVLLNMVTEEDLATAEDHQALVEEVRDECSKFGRLQSVVIPREVGSGVEATAVRKVFLEYASPEDAARAEEELTGRQFGPHVVETRYYSERDFAAGQLR